MIFSTFIPWTASTTDSMIGQTAALLSDIMPLLEIIVGVGIALIVVSAIISAIRK